MLRGKECYKWRDHRGSSWGGGLGRNRRGIRHSSGDYGGFTIGVAGPDGEEARRAASGGGAGRSEVWSPVRWSESNVGLGVERVGGVGDC